VRALRALLLFLLLLLIVVVLLDDDFVEATSKRDLGRALHFCDAGHCD